MQIRSPISGTVLTLDVQHELKSRPVARGQVLFTVADPNSGWLLLAEIPQDRIGHVVAAQQSEPSPPRVRFRMAGDGERTYAGHLETIREIAALEFEGATEELPAIQAEIEILDQSLAVARPGMNAEVRIDCGRRSLGYVWLHDAWEAVYRWVVF